MAEPRFAGEPVTLGGATFIAPPIAIGRMVRLKKTIDALDGADEEAVVAIGLDLIHASLSRNYPSLTRDDVEVMVEPGDFQPAFDTVVALSGLTKKARTDGLEGNGPGAASPPSTGTPSTPAAATTSAGPGSTSTSS